MKITVNVKSEKQGEEKNEFSAEGSFCEKDGAYYITYTEPGLDKATTTLKTDKEGITLIRFGENGMKLKFKKGIKTQSIYKTPFGSFEMGVIPDKVLRRIGKCDGEIQLAYMLDFAGEKSYNKFNLNYKIQEG